jgi:DNA polymerase-3 subunit epsilon
VRKVFWFDLETTGVFDKTCAILQLAGLVEIDGQIVNEINLKARPHEGAFISDEALLVNGLDEATIMSYPSHTVMYSELVNFICKYVNKFNKKDKFVLGGYNVGFDDGFLRELFYRCGDKFYGSLFAWPKLDVQHLIAEQYADGLRLPDHKLSTICSHFGIPLDAHEAMGDIVATRNLYYKLRGGKAGS